MSSDLNETPSAPLIVISDTTSSTDVTSATEYVEKTARDQF